jgi:hypothetical protein
MTTSQCGLCHTKPAQFEMQPGDSPETNQFWRGVCEPCLKQVMTEYPLRVRRIGKK